ncbi:MAG TPA: hypothetical protein EYM65_07250, partial [Dehalococcoidia bacterium]|nr:hypothetical protein [Dehalococcoidia bacterium]
MAGRNSLKYHLFQVTAGWIGLIGAGNGVRRLSLQPAPQDTLDDMGPELEQSENDPAYFAKEQQCLE